ncbi:DNA-binding protein (plasmid) [Buttiauxella sp. 3AFRM03]|uniref:H-NS histone family protein n=1 Tax=Buttiauxella sp. 3AFRM03 TaxID=2479367 RepID=UPI000EF791D1|nr:H-NS family nucleoid-associated regulatory protein [Buttiauxella sp. 3AFRM03]AYN25696.1 DNA-binding protein [Buttiauxella sp. 3AFRM03]
MKTTDIISYLSAERTLKKFLKDADFDCLNALNKRILSALEAKKAEHEEFEKQRIDREEKRNELMALIAAEGFSMNELLGEVAPKNYPKRKPKYVYIEDGITKYWSGVGRTPRPIQDGVNSGKQLNEYLIKGN